MKKTLIALMALAGIACGSTEPAPYTGAALDSWLNTFDAQSSGKAYILTFKIGEWTAPNGTNGVIFYINESSEWGIYHQTGQYLGLSEGGNAPVGDFACRKPNSANYSSTVDMDGAENGVGDDYSGWFYESGSYGTGLQGLTIKIDSSNANGTNIILTTADGSRTVSLNRNGHTSLDKLSFALDSMVFESASVDISGVGSFSYVPEPATATLSLLALAGLAARRRRK